MMGYNTAGILPTVFLPDVAISLSGTAAAWSLALLFVLIRSVSGRYARRRPG